MSAFNDRINSNQLTLVDFFATWCGPCKTMAPMLTDLKKRVGDDASILKIDVDQNPSLAQKFKIQSVPTLVLFKNGKPLWRQSGVVPVHQLEQIVNQYK
jgi:thioredoxin 1